MRYERYFWGDAAAGVLDLPLEAEDMTDGVGPVSGVVCGWFSEAALDKVMGDTASETERKRSSLEACDSLLPSEYFR